MEHQTAAPIAHLAGTCGYAAGLIALAAAEVLRGFSPAMFFLWGLACDLAGFALVAAVAGWAVGRFAPLRRMFGLPRDAKRDTPRWFFITQAALMVTTALLTAWIASDIAFEGMGEGIALLGLSGRMAACPAALMLVGAAIVMAWQAAGRWRAGWQFAAMAAGILFTGSVGWARLDAARLPAPELWFQRCFGLLISASMMTLLTSIGLARVLPHCGDWIERGRRAAPVFALLAAGLLIATCVLAVSRG